MWNLPTRQPLQPNDPAAYSIAEDLRVRAYDLQALGGSFDAMMLRAVDGDPVAVLVLRELLLRVSHEVLTVWGGRWVAVSIEDVAGEVMQPVRTVRKSVVSLLSRRLLQRRRLPSPDGGTSTLFLIDPHDLCRVLDVATWQYLSERFPDAPRPELDPDALAWVKRGAADTVSGFRTAQRGSSASAASEASEGAFCKGPESHEFSERHSEDLRP